MPTAPLDDDALILARPHYRLEGSDLVFLISKRASTTLTSEERDVWLALMADPRVSSLRARFGASVDTTLRAFVAKGLCEPCESSWPAGRKRVLVFEPHSDDAALSVGATMWQRRHDTEFTLVTLGGRSNFTSYYYLFRDYFDADEVSTLRADEARLFMRLLGGHYVALPHDEAPLRYRGAPWTLDWFKEHRTSIAAFDNHRSNATERASWKASVRATIEAHPADEIWFPLGVGTHTDHELTRDAVLESLIEDPSLGAHATVRLFQDVPYDGHFEAHADAIVSSLRGRGAVIERETVSIEGALDAKLRLVSVFASQFKLDAVRDDIVRSASLARAGTGTGEVLFTLAKRPTSHDSLETFVDRDLVRSEAPRIARWVAKREKAARIRLLLLMPAGRFHEDVEELLRTFPRATFEVYGTAVSLPEASSFASPRVRFRRVDRGAKAWVALAFELGARRPALTLFLAGDKLSRGRALAKLWRFSDPIVLPTLDHFMRGLAHALPQESKRESVSLTSFGFA